MSKLVVTPCACQRCKIQSYKNARYSLFRVADRVVSAIHHQAPGTEILARAHDKECCRSLQALGAHVAVSENLEASIALAQEALTRVAGEDAENTQAIDRFREVYYAGTRGESRDFDPDD